MHLFVVYCFSKYPFVQGFLLHVFSIINKKGRFDPNFVFILCLFWKNGNTKNPKKFFNHS